LKSKESAIFYLLGKMLLGRISPRNPTPFRAQRLGTPPKMEPNKDFLRKNESISTPSRIMLLAPDTAAEDISKAWPSNRAVRQGFGPPTRPLHVSQGGRTRLIQERLEGLQAFSLADGSPRLC